MTYYRDLSPYVYLGDRTAGMVNVGWLGAGEDFPRGDCPDEIVRRLIALAASPRNLTRGRHHCEFCAVGSPVRAESDDGTVAWLGNGEVHVRSGDGPLYAAPTLVVHYIQAHRYLPPRDFRDAVGSLSPEL
jgi:hypothetical protein